MTLSIVIPSYDMVEPLRNTLRFLAAQRDISAIAPQLIVVDDGSTDDTAAVVHECAGSFPELRYVQRARDEQSGRAAARNSGLSESRAEHVLFVDSGVLLEPDFLVKLAAKLHTRSGSVFLHRCVGVHADCGTPGAERVQAAEPATLLDVVAELDDPLWTDSRERLVAACSEDLARLPAWWSLGWTGVMTVPRRAALDIGGFDVSYRGWGGEDVDFTYRLHQHGVTGRGAMDCVAVRLPRKGARGESDYKNEKRNRLLLHRKAFTLETEVYAFLGGVAANLCLERLARLELSYLVPQLPRFVIAFLQGQLAMSSAGPTLIVGADGGPRFLPLPATHYLAHNETTRATIQRCFPERNVVQLVGAKTPFVDQHFDAAVVTDFVRLLPYSLQVALLADVARVSKLALVICSPDESDDQPWTWLHRDAAGFPWVRRAELVAAAARVGLTLTAVFDQAGYAVLRVAVAA
jgi:glycosyltransferase involved in cell wall biosynthesis